MAESTKDLVAKRDMQLRMFDSIKENKKTKGNLPNKKDNARQATLNKNSSAEGARKAGKEKFFETHNEDGTPKNKEKEVKGMKKMNMGGMATANKYDKNKKERSREADMQSGKLRFEKQYTPKMSQIDTPRMERPPGMKKGGVAKKMNMGGMAKASYSKGSKVRGYGMARGGKACKMR